jgi:hypothetical protein
VPEDVRGSLRSLLRREPGEAVLHIRALVGRMARTFQVALLLDDAQACGGEPGIGWLGAAAELLLIDDRASGYDAGNDPAYPKLIDQALAE